MTPRVSAAGGVSLATEVLDARLLLDIHGDQLNFSPSVRTITAHERRFLRQAVLFCDTNGSAIVHGYNNFDTFGRLEDDGQLMVSGLAITTGTVL